jgi:hypothetical protein
MKYYFQLQYVRCTRFLREIGIHPLLAILFFTAVFIIISFKIVHSISHGQWVYILLSTTLHSRIKNTELLNISFPRKTLRLLRVVEACLFSIPFSLFLMASQFYLEATLLLLLNGTFSLVEIRTNLSYYLPTPFQKRPFEFIVGFRKTWLIILLLYILCIIAMSVGNLNLGLVSIGFMYFTMLGYYVKPENEVFIWMYHLSPGKFLIKKAITALSYSSILATPLIFTMYFNFPESWISITIILYGGSILIILGMLNKYCYFPQESELINGILIGLGILFPPLLPVIFIYLSNKASQNLKKYL